MPMGHIEISTSNFDIQKRLNDKRYYDNNREAILFRKKLQYQRRKEVHNNTIKTN